MDTYALTKLIASAEEVDSRKRLHKCVFLIQLSGLDMNAEYCLHYYGPFSRDVAETTDLLTQSGILEEESHPQQIGKRYSYRVTAKGKKMLSDYETTPKGKTACQRVTAFAELLRSLTAEPLWTLELASTVAYYRFDKGLDRPQARAKTAEFKRVDPKASVLTEAEGIADRFAPSKI